MSESTTLDILYEDEYIIAVNKPAGLLVHPSWIAPVRTPNLLALLKARYPGETLHTIHRLDRATSGVILFARDKTVAQRLQQQFIDRTIKKTYLCVVRGWTEEEGLIDYALKPIHDKREDQRANQDFAIHLPVGKNEQRNIEKKINDTGCINISCICKEQCTQHL